MINPAFKWQPIMGATIANGKSYTGPIGAAAMVQIARTVTIPAGMMDGAAQLAADMQSYAHDNAKWTDRTGEAREELAGVPFAEGDTVGASIVHGAAHGLFLENMESRPDLAIIRQTQEAFMPVALRIIGGGVRAALEGRGSKVRSVGSGRFAK